MKTLALAVFCSVVCTAWMELCSKMCSDNKVSKTFTGLTCQRWGSQSPHKHRFGRLADQGNYCRNPDGEAGPWCYTTDPKRRWQLCCDCKTSKQGKGYRGEAYRKTVKGVTCQRWDSQSPHRHLIRGLNNQENFCRNPDGEPNGPWCYTTLKTKRWDYCGVPSCHPL